LPEITETTGTFASEGKKLIGFERGSQKIPRMDTRGHLDTAIILLRLPPDLPGGKGPSRIRPDPDHPGAGRILIAGDSCWQGCRRGYSNG
jgi:hypothetical protein